MSNREHRGNGRDPLIAPLPPQRPMMTDVPRNLPRASWEELARVYANVVAQDHQHLKAIYKELDEIRPAINTIPARLEHMVKESVAGALNDALEQHAEQLRDELKARVEGMRDELPSVEDMEAGVKRAASEAFDDMIEKTNPGLRLTTLPGFPPPPPVPDQKSDSDRVREVIADEHLAADGRTLRRIRKWFWGVAAGVAVAVVISILGFMWKLSAEVAKAHEQGLLEGVNRQPPPTSAPATSPAFIDPIPAAPVPATAAPASPHKPGRSPSP